MYSKVVWCLATLSKCFVLRIDFLLSPQSFHYILMFLSVVFLWQQSSAFPSYSASSQTHNWPEMQHCTLGWKTIGSMETSASITGEDLNEDCYKRQNHTQCANKRFTALGTDHEYISIYLLFKAFYSWKTKQFNMHIRGLYNQSVCLSVYPTLKSTHPC